MGVIEDFIRRYRKEYDFYDQAARLVAQLLEARLQVAGVRAMVTSPLCWPNKQKEMWA